MYTVLRFYLYETLAEENQFMVLEIRIAVACGGRGRLKGGTCWLQGYMHLSKLKELYT